MTKKPTIDEKLTALNHVLGKQISPATTSQVGATQATLSAT